jgi:pilus assembly protein Flp/PilA
MRPFASCVVNFLQAEDGPTAMEYAVMLTLIIVVCITAITALGSNANNTFTVPGARGPAVDAGTRAARRLGPRAFSGSTRNGGANRRSAGS